MTNFKTIDEKTILTFAHHGLMTRWLKELEVKDRLIADGKKATIAEIKAKRYKEQLDEVEARIYELEQEEA